jgi:PhnB protein
MTDYPAMIPYLSVADADAAIDFYRRAFGATEKLRVPGQDRRIMHAEVRVGAALVMLTDSAPDLGFAAPGEGDRVPVGLMVRWPSPADVDRLHDQAVAAGGTSETAPRDEPWGARYAAVRDPFGHRWWLFAMLQEKEEEETSHLQTLGQGP